MTRQAVTGQFRTQQSGPIPNRVNITDYFSSAAIIGGIWTPGATLIDIANLSGPTPQQKWTLESVSIQANLTLSYTTTPFGKLGKIIAGLLPTQQLAQSGQPSSPWVTPMLPLPADTTLTEELWNSANDPLPPNGENSSNPTSVLPVNAVISPPLPVKIVPGEPPFIGIWITPSLVGWQQASAASLPNNWLTLFDATYVINYDDGQ